MLARSSGERIRDYWDRAAPRFGTGSQTIGLPPPLPDDHPLWLGVIAHLIDQPGGRPVRRVADLGTGAGAVAGMLARLGFEVVAVDFAPAMVARTRERLAGLDGVQVRTGDAHDPPLDVGEIDAIISRNMTWLLTDPQRAVNRWAELVGPGGRVAAIDGTWFSDRPLARAHRLLQFLHPDPRRRPARGTDNPNLHTPLSRMSDPSPLEKLWGCAGLTEVKVVDLQWVGAVERLEQARRGPRLIKHFAVTGRVP